MIIIALPINTGYSFVIQAKALATGFNQVGIEHHLLYVADPQELFDACKHHKAKAVLAIGNWPNYPLIIEPALNAGCDVFPWLVSDEYSIDQYVAEYNKLGILLTPSEHCKKNFVRSGIKADIIHVVPEAVDPEEWYPVGDKELESFLNFISIPNPPNALRKTFDVSLLHKKGVPIIYTTGGDATKKGAQDVMRALALLDPKLEWIYMIKTWARPNIFEKSIEELNLAEELGIFHRIRYIVGEYSQLFMRDIMNTCDIYAAPSRLEGFGLPHVEAQMCGKAVVSLEHTAPEETIIHGETGFLCKNAGGPKDPHADINDLAHYLEKLITNPKLRTSMGKAAIEHARSKYSPTVVASAMVDLMQRPG